MSKEERLIKVVSALPAAMRRSGIADVSLAEQFLIACRVHGITPARLEEFGISRNRLRGVEKGEAVGSVMLHRFLSGSGVKWCFFLCPETGTSGVGSEDDT